MLYNLIIFLFFLIFKNDIYYELNKIELNLSLRRFPPPNVVHNNLEFQKARLDYLAFMLENGWGLKQDVLLEYEDLKNRYRLWDKLDDVHRSIDSMNISEDLVDLQFMLGEEAFGIGRMPEPVNMKRFDDANR